VPPASQQQQPQIQQPKQQGSLISITSTNLEVETISAPEVVNPQIFDDLHESSNHVEPEIDLAVPAANTLNLVVASTSRQEVSNSIQLETSLERVPQT